MPRPPGVSSMVLSADSAPWVPPNQKVAFSSPLLYVLGCCLSCVAVLVLPKTSFLLSYGHWPPRPVKRLLCLHQHTWLRVCLSLNQRPNVPNMYSFAPLNPSQKELGKWVNDCLLCAKLYSRGMLNIQQRIRQRQRGSQCEGAVGHRANANAARTIPNKMLFEFKTEGKPLVVRDKKDFKVP